jgi:hypothetical protein
VSILVGLPVLPAERQEALAHRKHQADCENCISIWRRQTKAPHEPVVLRSMASTFLPCSSSGHERRRSSWRNSRKTLLDVRKSSSGGGYPVNGGALADKGGVRAVLAAHVGALMGADRPLVCLDETSEQLLAEDQ